MKAAIAVALTTLGLSAAAGAVTSASSSVEKDACVSLTRIGGLRALDSRTAVIFSSMGKPSYVVTLSAPLPELKFAHRYAYIDRDRDGRLCGRSRDGIALPDESVRIPTTIMAMTPLDTQSVEALELKYDVKLSRKRKNEPARDEQDAGAADSA
jgi:Family of unknown function (DUF6491)